MGVIKGDTRSLDYSSEKAKPLEITQIDWGMVLLGWGASEFGTLEP